MILAGLGDVRLDLKTTFMGRLSKTSKSLSLISVGTLSTYLPNDTMTTPSLASSMNDLNSSGRGPAGPFTVPPMNLTLGRLGLG